MGVSDLQFDTNAGPVVDLSARGMQKLDPGFICSEDTHTLILDRNQIMKLDYLERSPGLQQLSVASNRLVRMMGVSWLKELKVLNLPNNSIGYIEGLRDLPNLTWLNLSGNNIKVIEQLNNCISLQHLDLSDNNISSIGDLTKLVALKTLLLHGNSITTLRTVPAHLPAHVSILSLAENEIRDLNEVSYLSPLHELEQLSIMSNPCVMATPLLPGFDYRPFIMSWCLSLKVLDGYVVSQKEGLKAEWLYSQGKGRSYRPGQHVQLVEYLATVCPLTSSPALETAEDAKLEKILSKQRFHQRQLMEESQGGCPSPPRPTQLDVEKLSPLHAEPQGGARELKKVPAGSPASGEKEPVVQYNTWINSDSAQPSFPVVRSPRREEEHVYLEDMQGNEDDADGSMLSSESTFFPLTSYQEPQATRSDSEDETETFEPDSLAPRRPAQHKKPNPTKQHPTATVDQQDKSGVTSHIGATQEESLLRANTPTVEMNKAHKQDEGLSGFSKAVSVETDRAVVRIQSWWRGEHTRCCHPMAREVRSEIRLRRMQDHIIFLSEKLNRVQQQYEEEKLQRLVQEEAVRCLWKQLQSMQQWKQSVEQQLSNISQSAAAPPPKSPAPAPCNVASPAACGTANAATDVSFPDSGFQTTGERQAGRGRQDDSFLSSGTADSLKTVRALSPARDGVDSADCSLLEQYLSSVQQREEEGEDATSDRTETPQPLSPASARKPSPPPPPETEAEEQIMTGAAAGHV